MGGIGALDPIVCSCCCAIIRLITCVLDRVLELAQQQPAALRVQWQLRRYSSGTRPLNIHAPLRDLFTNATRRGAVKLMRCVRYSCQNGCGERHSFTPPALRENISVHGFSTRRQSFRYRFKHAAANGRTGRAFATAWFPSRTQILFFCICPIFCGQYESYNTNVRQDSRHCKIVGGTENVGLKVVPPPLVLLLQLLHALQET